MSQDHQDRMDSRTSPARYWRELTRKRPPESAPIRWNLVHEVRAAIAAGQYDSDEKLQIALDRMAIFVLA